MSEMGFGYYTGDLGDGTQDGADVTQQQQAQQQDGQPQQGNGLRQYLKTLEEKAKKQEQMLQELLAESARNKVADQLEAKGYDRGAAALYAGDPTKVDDWLATAGPLLAKKPDPQGQGGAAGAGGGAGTGAVALEGQAQLQAFQQAGQNAAAPQGSDAEMAAAIAQTGSTEELIKYLADNGNQYAQLWNG